MEYIFGETTELGTLTENVKTVGTEPSDLKGFVTVERDYPDCVITDRFKVTSHYKTKIGEDGTVYDWYTISDHIRYIDKSKVSEAENTKTHALIDYVAMMTDVDIPQSMLEGK